MNKFIKKVQQKQRSNVRIQKQSIKHRKQIEYKNQILNHLNHKRKQLQHMKNQQKIIPLQRNASQTAIIKQKQINQQNQQLLNTVHQRQIKIKQYQKNAKQWLQNQKNNQLQKHNEALKRRKTVQLHSQFTRKQSQKWIEQKKLKLNIQQNEIIKPRKNNGSIYAVAFRDTSKIKKWQRKPQLNKQVFVISGSNSRVKASQKTNWSQTHKHNLNNQNQPLNTQHPNAVNQARRKSLLEKEEEDRRVQFQKLNTQKAKERGKQALRKLHYEQEYLRYKKQAEKKKIAYNENRMIKGMSNKHRGIKPITYSQYSLNKQIECQKAFQKQFIRTHINHHSADRYTVIESKWQPQYKSPPKQIQKTWLKSQNQSLIPNLSQGKYSFEERSIFTNSSVRNIPSHPETQGTYRELSNLQHNLERNQFQIPISNDINSYKSKQLGNGSFGSAKQRK